MKMTVDKQIGIKLAKARKRKALSLRVVAARTGIKLTKLWRLEQGESAEKIRAAVRLAKFYGTTVEKLYPSKKVA